jgi:hypothetical protein
MLAIAWKALASKASFPKNWINTTLLAGGWWGRVERLELHWFVHVVVIDFVHVVVTNFWFYVLLPLPSPSHTQYLTQFPSLVSVPEAFAFILITFHW